MRRVGIVGLGLVGGSLGLALRRAMPGMEVIGVARRPETAAEALRVAAVSSAGTTLAGLTACDLVVLAAPLAATPGLLSDMAPHLAEGARVTDVGSVKGWVVAAAKDKLDLGRNPFMGGHPMAGREVGGIENADVDLFRERPWVFTPEGGSAVPPVWDDWLEAVAATGARPVLMSPSQHDRQVALVSHVPFLLSAGYLLGAGRSEVWDRARLVASSGFRDISRLGAGDPDMYTAIVEANREEVLKAWTETRAALEELEGRMTGPPGALRDLLDEARRTRHEWELADR
jgi:prephenate dehydrogenase